ncbi:MAG: TetR/AcrR family transcriptional regulator [Stenomitos rutilans HA7619-LM2]|jgi:AcrR family transcriptional regulator|nr:TetR/AcrR family transcriptional regulator [Stenomitos rutilans HA7619-LM2]
MSAQRNPTRQRLIHAALELFAVQGVTDTTTRQIAELADVNEVTLFRHFGNKHGLLLAVIEDAGVFAHLGQTLIRKANQTSNIYQALKDYATASLAAMDQVPAVVRSVVGEAGQYPAKNREAIGRGFTQANRYVAKYFETVIKRGQLDTHIPAEKLAGLLNGMLLGYAVIEFTSEFHQLWQDRDDFLENLVTLFLQGAVSPSSEASPTALGLLPFNSTATLTKTAATEKVADLPASLVHTILQRAKKLGLQEYAIAYVLFGAGLSPLEICQLERSHHISDPHQQLLQITQGAVRQVPVNQWLMGKRYGSYTRNPLTQWLRSRKDSQPATFLNPSEQPLAERELLQLWHSLTDGLLTPDGQPPVIEQTQQTWCVELLMRGMSLANMRLLTGWDVARLQPYVDRAKEKAALEQALRLDHKA